MALIKFRYWMIALLLACTTAVTEAKDDNPAYTDPDEAGIDFKIQGEYDGVLQADGSRWGAQIVALGDGQFRCIGFFGGLPGDGWQRGDESNEGVGKLNGEVAVVQAERFKLRIDGERLLVETNDGDPIGELKKKHRKSPTLGAKPPEGAIVLFDGTGVDQWNDGEIAEGKWLAATNPSSKEEFGDHHLHLEFRTPFMPKSRGQGRGNSGVYVQSRYEVQVLDSFGLDGKNNECGGIYSIGEPDVNMCLPPLSWQTYDIDFTAAKFDDDGNKLANARATIKHNGVVVHDDIELPHTTPGRITTEDASPAPLYLQDHSNPVVFRNVWVVPRN